MASKKQKKEEELQQSREKYHDKKHKILIDKQNNLERFK